LTGLEPATFRVTGGRSNQLSYNPNLYKYIILAYSSHFESKKEEY
jgi:hypothetical protein